MDPKSVILACWGSEDALQMGEFPKMILASLATLRGQGVSLRQFSDGMLQDITRTSPECNMIWEQVSDQIREGREYDRKPYDSDDIGTGSPPLSLAFVIVFRARICLFSFRWGGVNNGRAEGEQPHEITL